MCWGVGERWEKVEGVGKCGGGVGESEKRCGNSVLGCGEVMGERCGGVKEVWGSVRRGVGCVGEVLGEVWGSVLGCGEVCWGMGKCWGRSGEVC